MTGTELTRRQLLLGACALGFSGTGFAIFTHRKEHLLLSAADQDGQHWVLGTAPDGRIHFRLPVPCRAHDSAWLGDSLAVFFARRPGRETYLVDVTRGELRSTLYAPAGLHFCGHGVLSADRQHLYMTEYAYEQRMGVVGIYETHPPFARLGQMNTGGLDPH